MRGAIEPTKYNYQIRSWKDAPLVVSLLHVIPKHGHRNRIGARKVGSSITPGAGVIDRRDHARSEL